MTFWKALRWIGSLVFIALVVTIWLDGPSSLHAPTGSNKLPLVPPIH